MGYEILVQTKEGLEWMSIGNPPVLKAWYARHRLFVWCMHCARWHSHSETDGHRQAHCVTENSPYKQTGYVLHRVGLWSSASRPKHRQRERLCRACKDVALSEALPARLCEQCEANWQRQYGEKEAQRRIQAEMRTTFALTRAPGWLALRFQILKRDDYRCRLCGVAAKDGDHVRLEVDHITARANGGTDDASNLWTLCFECNHGKGTKDL